MTLAPKFGRHWVGWAGSGAWHWLIRRSRKARGANALWRLQAACARRASQARTAGQGTNGAL